MSNKQNDHFNEAIKEANVESKSRQLKPLNTVIQVCPKCGKVDVYKNDNHFCDSYSNFMKDFNDEYYD